MATREEIREGVAEVLSFPHEELEWEEMSEHTKEGYRKEALILSRYLHSRGVVIKVDRELPYKWREFTRTHRYRPYREFTTHALSNKFDKMFGYIQRYQCMGEANDLYEKPERYIVYLGDIDFALSDISRTTLRKAKEYLLDKFLSSKDNPDNDIPVGYEAVEPLIEE